MKGEREIGFKQEGENVHRKTFYFAGYLNEEKMQFILDYLQVEPEQIHISYGVSPYTNLPQTEISYDTVPPAIVVTPQD